MLADSDNPSVGDLVRRKKIARDHLRNLSPTEKIRELESLQRRYYSLLLARESGGGRAIPRKWRIWKLAQDELTAPK